ncbi:Inorganic pyrophosphatase [Patulibacter medicamentivorans]|uniref:Inorganic pyrophosphatase n=1 Tax=Patulibacter medicamentivorans TaxID=1097667 RepID=H0E5A7_9ACTN|nr:inorganic diphosphatase [Patulibacter medicamentivorans]EHN11140.1 Inorganic pyrophosphatase [Patulibacter medicamentivorans]
MSELLMFVEIPKGSRNKYEWDPEVGAIVFDRYLYSSVVYPADYGFITDTLGEDGDPLDALCLVSDPTFPGCRIPVRAVGLFKMIDNGEVDDKVVCVPVDDPNWKGVETLDDISDQLKTEISHFFAIYKQPEGKIVEVQGYRSREEALDTVAAAKQRLLAAK